jgi:replication fork protection complex subunit Tof1/Swi1
MSTTANDPDTQKLLLHRQQGIKDEAGTILDLKKRKRFFKANKVDELGFQDNLDVNAKTILQGTAKTFIQACFNCAMTHVHPTRYYV